MLRRRLERFSTSGPGGSGMGVATRPIPEAANLVLTFAQVLHANGQSTPETVAASERLASQLGLRATIVPRWDALELWTRDGTSSQVLLRQTSPTGVDMDRVASAMNAIDEICSGQLARTAADKRILAISQAAPAPTWMFTLAAAAGSAALAVLFGIQHLAATVLIIVSAAAGALLRRALAHYSTNVLVQPFCASLVAGIIGALAVRYQLSSSLRLVAVCPCMILVPGPHVLNGMIDLIEARISLGASRLVYAGLIIVSIAAGLLLGLGLLGVSLPVNEAGRSVPFGLDVIAAGVAVAAYSVFFSTPLHMLPWPVAVGMLAHGLRWWTLLAGASAATGALVACLVVGVILAPVARSSRMPFAAIGFASVVSMIPGIFLFRMASGLVQLVNSSNTTLQLLSATIADGITAATIVLAMTFGVVVPKIVIDQWAERSTLTDP